MNNPPKTTSKKFWQDRRMVTDSLASIPRPADPVPADLPDLTPEQSAEGDLTEEIR